MQRADRRLNAQLLDSELDDTLESFEVSCNLGSSAMASVRGSANKQSMGVSREKDKADRATYQTVLDPRTRLVMHQSSHYVVCYLQPKRTDNKSMLTCMMRFKPPACKCIAIPCEHENGGSSVHLIRDMH